METLKIVLVFVALSFGSPALASTDPYEQLAAEAENHETRIKALEAFQKKLGDDFWNFVKIWKYALYNLGHGNNLAEKKVASQSSISDDGYASRAVDGKTSGQWSDLSCTHTASELDPWWQVDFGEKKYFKRVVIYNREDCCGERLHKLNVMVKGKATDHWLKVGGYPGTSHNGEEITIIFDKTAFAQYLRIQINNVSILTMCEVKVFLE